MKKSQFYLSAILLLIIFPQVIFQIMDSQILIGLSDLSFYLLDYALFTLGGILGVILLWTNGFRDMFKIQFQWGYLVWFVLIFILNTIWVLVIFPIVSSHTDKVPLELNTFVLILPNIITHLKLLHNLILAPFVEEILWRGIIFSLFKKWENIYLDVLASGIIFSINHFIYYGWQNIEFIRYFIPGILIASLFRKTKCIYYPIIYHVLWNAVPYLMGWK
ncbi:CPBP family intramembrane glutamic endopeptidase [Streptococcus fryi]